MMALEFKPGTGVRIGAPLALKKTAQEAVIKRPLLRWSSSATQQVYDQSFGKWQDPELAQQVAYAFMAHHNCTCKICARIAYSLWYPMPLKHVWQIRREYQSRHHNALAEMKMAAANERCLMLLWMSRLEEVAKGKDWL